MIIQVHILSSFTKKLEGGNSAGVVLNSEELSDQQMQEIARKVGLSETAFVQKSKQADYTIKFFTPNGEVALCGHATIASFSLMAELKLLAAGIYTQETKAGILEVEVEADGGVFMEQNLPEFGEVLDREEIAASLNISQDVFKADFPIQIVSTGLRDILIPIRSLAELSSIQPNFDQVAQLSKKYNVVGYHMFSQETKFNSTAHCRNLAPLYDIPEEAATGTSNGALACYLWKHGKVDGRSPHQMAFEQGYSMGKPSEVLVQLKAEEELIKGVKVGGKAVIDRILELDV